MTIRKLTPLGVQIKKALIDKNMSQVELAEQVGTSKQYLNLILYGERSGKKYMDQIKDVLELEQ